VNGSGANEMGPLAMLVPGTGRCAAMDNLETLEELFAGRHFIILCVRWYLRSKLSLRDLR
jgi:hypothetical protein